MNAFGYIDRESPIHRLTGASKLIMTVAFSAAAMITFDTRFLAGVIVLSLAMFALSKIHASELGAVLALIAVFLIINNAVIFLFAPEEGVKIYGTRHEYFHIAGRYYAVAEQLFYQLNVTLKYFAIVPAALVFFLTTQPSEFASSLNRLKVGYRAAYAVSLSMRYIPDVQRAYGEISRAQQARGIDISKKAPITKRLSGVLAILFPLVFSSVDKIDVISNALELRGFGRGKTRSWYCSRKFAKGDAVVIAISAVLLIVSALTIFINNGRFYNPFI